MATCRRSIVMGAFVLAVALVMPALTVNAAPPARTPDIVKTTPAAVVSQPLAEVSRLYFERLKMEGEKPGPIQYREVNPLNTEIPAPRARSMVLSSKVASNPSCARTESGPGLVLATAIAALTFSSSYSSPSSSTTCSWSSEAL